ncbi:MAG: hypothetical protein P8L37_07510, partial [Phycisphaerales bacterium]|nr:hypothetical protein [Phycisphaerales bacterium]
MRSAIVSKDSEEFEEIVHVHGIIIVDVRVASATAILTELPKEEEQVVDRDTAVAIDVAEAVRIIAFVRDSIAIGVLTVAIG